MKRSKDVARRRIPARAAAVLLGGIAALLTLEGGGCGGGGGISVKTDYDHGADFSRYHTFGFGEARLFAANGAPDNGNTLLLNRVRSVVTSQLASHEIPPAPAGQTPDLTVSFTLGARQSDQIVPQIRPNVGVTVGGGGPWWSVGTGDWWATRKVNEQTFVLDLTDTGSRQLVWRGFASGNLNGSGLNPDEDAMNKIVGQMLKDFPPKR